MSGNFASPNHSRATLSEKHNLGDIAELSAIRTRLAAELGAPKPPAINERQHIPVDRCTFTLQVAPGEVLPQKGIIAVSYSSQASLPEFKPGMDPYVFMALANRVTGASASYPIDLKSGEITLGGDKKLQISPEESSAIKTLMAKNRASPADNDLSGATF